MSSLRTDSLLTTHHSPLTMNIIPIIAIYDIGKTNKKLLLFNEHYQLVQETCKQFAEIKDEDGFECEDVQSLTTWIKDSFEVLLSDEKFTVKAVNFSAYGASFVYLDEALNVCLPLYNYLKPFDPQLQQQFYDTYGGESLVAKQTASPVLGNLNSGMQLYRLKYEQPAAFARIKYALHLPQYLSFILTNKIYADITSIGCHTNLWDFEKNQYHDWVKQEGIDTKLPAVLNGESIAGYTYNTIPVGVGLHDSSAALIPYLAIFHEPFILLSTGTWCINLNPFNQAPLTTAELENDCLCYMSFEGKPVKASRLFAGYEHEQQLKRIAEYFKQDVNHYKTIPFDAAIIAQLKIKFPSQNSSVNLKASAFTQRELAQFKTGEEAYHRLMMDIIAQQVYSTQLVLKNTGVNRIFVDGGFGRNAIYMNLLARNFPELEVFAASMAQATAVGTALSIHRAWNKKALPNDIIELKYFAAAH